MQSHTVQSSPNCRGWFGLPLTIADPYSKLSRRSDGRKRLVVIHIWQLSSHAAMAHMITINIVWL